MFFIALFLNSVFQQPVRPNGWEKRSDAVPYLSETTNALPQAAAGLDGGLREAPGFEVHVRTTPGSSTDDWRAKTIATTQPITFRLHRDAWPSDDWVWYQMLGRVAVKEAGRTQFGFAIQTGDAGTGCFGNMMVGGATAVQMDLPTFFAQRKPKDPGRDELLFVGPLNLTPGTYDMVVTIGCHPAKIGKPIPPKRLEAWRDTRIMLVQQGPRDAMLRPLRLADVTHAER